MPKISSQITPRTYCFIFLVVLSSFIFWKPLNTVFRLSLANEHYSHVALMPVLSAYLLYSGRKRIFAAVSSAPRAGGVVVLIGIAIALLSNKYTPSFHAGDVLSLHILSLVAICIGLFLLCFGAQAFHAGIFPLLLLLLAVPAPEFLLDKVIVALQEGSATSANVLFKILGVPVLREGFSFSLPGITVQVAQECSGIRSSLALLITSLLTGHLFLRSWWGKFGLCLAVIPLAIIKNGCRIVTLSWLGLYVNRGFLTGSLHHHGGILFFLLSLVFLAVIVHLLQLTEGQSQPLVLTPEPLGSRAGTA